MTLTSSAMRSGDFSPAALTTNDILENPHFAEALRTTALKLIELHEHSPRIARYVANLRKWLLTQAILALHFEHVTDPSRPGLTAASLLDFLRDNDVASRNTAAAHLAEMRAYRLLLDAAALGDRRSRPLTLADGAETLIRQWFDWHLKSLDMLDDGRRHEQSLADDQLLRYALPRAARRLFCHPGWSSPPDTIGTFVWTEAGSNILHDLISRLPSGPTARAARTWIGPLRLSDIASRYVISRSHAQRVFARARALDLIGWELPANRGNFWVSDVLVHDYRNWQAVKFSALDEAVQWSCERLYG